jgi:hypothetical protein
MAGPNQQPTQPGLLRAMWGQHEAIKNHLTSIAIVLGGVWTYFLFGSLHQVKRAEAELATLRQDPVANIDLTVSSLTFPDQRACGIMITASLQNTGRRTAILDFSGSPPLRVVRLRADSLGALFPDGSQSLQVLSIARDDNSVLRLPKASLLPTELTKYQFLLPNLGPGIYLIQFSVPVALADAPAPGWHWVARRLHVLLTSTHSKAHRGSRCTTGTPPT